MTTDVDIGGWSTLRGGAGGSSGRWARQESFAYGSQKERSRPTTQEVIAETFGRRIQDVNLLSVRKLHALHSQAAKLDAQITSRTAAMSRVSGDMASRPVSRRSIALTEAPGPSSCPASPGAGLMPSRGSRWGTGGGSPSAMTAWPAEQRPRPGTVGFRSSVGWEGLPDSPVDRTPLTIAERGTSTVRVLALQDRMLHSALRAAGLGAGGAEGTDLHGGRSQRFSSLLLSGGGGGGGMEPGSASEEELRRLDSLGIKYDSKVAAAAVTLFRLTPRKAAESQDCETPDTPPNTQRNEDGTVAAPSARARLQQSVHKAMLANKDFTRMNRFVRELQEADELSLINRARNYTKRRSSAGGGPATGRHPPSRGTASSGTPPGPHGDRVQSASAALHGSSSNPRRVGAASARVPGQAGDGGGSAPPSARGAVLASPTAAAAVAAAAALRGGSGGSPGVEVRRGTPRSDTIPEETALDVSEVASVPLRTTDTLDMLLRSVVDAAAADAGGGGGGGGGITGWGDVLAGQQAASAWSRLSTPLDAVPRSAPTEAPFAGTYGSPERMADRVRQRGELAVQCNPAGFREEVAAAEVAMYRHTADKGRTALQRAAAAPTDAAAAASLTRQVVSLHFARPFFKPPGQPPPEVVVPRPVSTRPASRPDPPHRLPPDSVFLPRATDNDSEDVIDTPTVRERQVRRDWNRVVRKERFRQLVGRDDPRVAAGAAGLGRALDDVLGVLMAHKDQLRAAFTYYSMQGTSVGDTCFAMGHNEWRAFVTDCGLAAIPSSTNPTPRHDAPYPTTTSSPSHPPASSQPHVASPHDPLASAPATYHAGGISGVDHAGAAVPRVPPLNLSAAALAAGSYGGGGARGRGSVPRASGHGMQQQQGHGATRGGQGVGHGRTGGASAPVNGGGGGGGAGGWSHSASLGLLQTADLVFEAVIFEDDKRSAEAKVNVDRAMMRFEWYEALIRMAVARHVKDGIRAESISAALQHMLSAEVVPRIAPAALHEPNGWRLEVLYADPRVNDVLVEHIETITAIYNLYRAPNKNKLVHLADWVGLLTATGLLGDATGVSQRDAKLAFVRSLCVVVDEVGPRGGRAVCLDRCDFMEALCRMAEELAPPAREQVAAALKEHVEELAGDKEALAAAMATPWLSYYSLVPTQVLQAHRRAALEAVAAAALADPVSRSSSIRMEGTLPPDNMASNSTLAVGSFPQPYDSAGASSLQPLLPPPQLESLPPQPSDDVGYSRDPPPQLWQQLQALLDVLLGRLREQWEAEDDEQLAVRLQATARSLQASGM